MSDDPLGPDGERRAGVVRPQTVGPGERRARSGDRGQRRLPVVLPCLILAVAFLAFGLYALATWALRLSLAALSIGAIILVVGYGIERAIGHPRSGTTTAPLQPWVKRWAIPVAIICLTVALIQVKYTVERFRRCALVSRAVEAANLRSVGQALAQYGSIDGAECPRIPDMLIEAGMITRDELQSPTDPDEANACDFYFIRYESGRIQPDAISSNWIVAYSDPAYHAGKGASILFVDGHVEFIREPEFSERIGQFKRAFEATCGAPPVIIEPH